MSGEQDGDQSVSQEAHAGRDAISAGHNLTINHYHRSGRKQKHTRKAKLAHPLSWKKLMIWAGGAVIVLAVAVAAALRAGLAQNPLPPHGYPSAVPAPRATPSLGSLSLTESHGTDELIVPIYNPQPADEQVQEIGIDIQWLACPTITNPPPPATFAIGGDLKVLTSGAVVGVVTPESGLGSGATARTVGSVKTAGDCIVEVKLDFRPPALLLRSKATTPISVMMPKNNIFTLSKATPVNANNKELPAFANAPTGGIQIPDFTGAPWMATITVRDNFGAQSSSCEMSATSTC